MPEETEEAPSPWTVKAVLPAIRKRAVESAGKRGEVMAVWLARAVTNQADREAGDGIIPPKPTVSPSVLPEANLPELADMLRAAVLASQAAGVPLPARTAKHAFKLLEGQLRAARGLPPLAIRSRQPSFLDGEAA